MFRANFKTSHFLGAIVLVVMAVGVQVSPASAASYSSQFVGQSPYPTVGAGSQATLFVDLKNAGTSDWLATGPNPVRLATSRPINRSSVFQSNSWLSANRPTSITGQVNAGVVDTADKTIEPGATARFEFVIRAPITNAQEFTEYFQLVADGAQFMEDLGVFWKITVTDNTATFNGNNVTFRNTTDSTTAFQVQNSAGTATPLSIDTTNNTVTVSTIQGAGGGLTSLNAANVASGTLADARLGANVTLQGNTFNGVSQLVRLDTAGALPAISGAALTALNAANISSGTLADARLSATVSLLGQAIESTEITDGTITLADQAGVRGVASIDPPSIAAQTCVVTSTAVAGLVVGDKVFVQTPTLLEAGLTAIANETDTADQLKVRICNVTGVAVDGLARSWPYTALR